MTGVTFGTYHSWNDWQLILKSRPEIEPPKVKRITTSIPARDGVLDMTLAVYGGIKYDNRDITFTFLTADTLTDDGWATQYSKILNAIHGQTMDIVLDEDPDWQYHGVCEVDSYVVENGAREVVVVCDCAPYKTKVADPSEKSL